MLKVINKIIKEYSNPENKSLILFILGVYSPTSFLLFGAYGLSVKPNPIVVASFFLLFLLSTAAYDYIKNNYHIKDGLILFDVLILLILSPLSISLPLAAILAIIFIAFHKILTFKFKC